MSYGRLTIITIVLGIIFVALFYIYFHEGFAITIALIAIFLMGVGFLIQRAFHRTDSFVEQLGEADILNRMWFPLQEELTDVVRTEGRVTEATSAWTTAPGLSKRETPKTFFTGMQRYVRQRELVASLAASNLATEESRQQLVAEQQNLLSRAEDLLQEVNRAINAIPGASMAVRRTRRAQPGQAAQRTRATATRRSARARQPASASRRSRAQTATSTQAGRHRPAPSRPTTAPMRIVDAAPKPSAPRPAPPPPRVTYTPMPSPPAVAAPAPREPEPPPAPSPVTASAPEPVVAAPAPSEPEPAATPSVPSGDLRLDVASVCEELFDPNRMSYETNRLFDDRYRDATVRWKGTARRANVYSYDFDFGDGGGTKAELDVYEVKQQYGSRAVKAFVQLPTEAADDIGGRIGEDVRFEGRLISCEGSARRLYVADARMVD